MHFFVILSFGRMKKLPEIAIFGPGRWPHKGLNFTKIGQEVGISVRVWICVYMYQYVVFCVNVYMMCVHHVCT